MQGEIKGCYACGSLVMMHRALDGASFLIPVSDAYLAEALKVMGVDAYLHDRLCRAEKIIIDLRKQLKEKS